MKTAVLNNEKNISVAARYILYIALILLCGTYFGLNRAQAGDAVPLDDVVAGPAAPNVDPNIDPNAALKDIMKQIGNDFKAIGQSYSDLTQTDANVAHANELVGLFTLALQRVPDTITQMPPANQAAATQDYQSQIKNMISLCQQLSVALQAKDTPTVLQVLNKMKAAQQQGHSEFKPDDPD